VRFLVDENLSPLLAVALCEAGHDAVHTRDLGMARSADNEVLDAARDQDRVVVSADTDFGTMFAATGAARPSLLLVRLSADRRAAKIAPLVLLNLADVEEPLARGAIVVLGDDRVRVRLLPLL
jgi:predicted nuclease of predicted toxin-antitoxin system